MAREKIQVDLEAQDNASKKIDSVADKAEQLEKLDPTVKVGVDTSKATEALGSFADEANALPASLTRTVGLIGGGGPAGIAGAAGVAAAGLAAMAKNTADTALEANAL